MKENRLHPRLGASDRRRLLRSGVELFNRGRFFEAHEPWEEIWRSTSPEPRDLFQGLVQVAAGLHHWSDRGKAAPAGRLLARGVRRLAPFRPSCLGIDVETLLGALEEWRLWLERCQGEPPEAPRIELQETASPEM